MPNHPPLTISDVTALAAVLDFASTGATVTWTPDEGETILSGVARSVGRENFNFLTADDDVRDGYLRVTHWGTEHALPVKDCMEWVRTGRMGVIR